jgi:lipoprotein-anchoring transpeptidase ErfK/SrfK
VRWPRPAWLQRVSRERLAILGRAVGVVAVLGLIAAGVTAFVLGEVGRDPGTVPVGVASPTAGASEHVVQPTQAPAAGYSGLPQATTFATIPAAPRDPAPSADTSGLVLHPLVAQVVYAGPGQQAVAVLPTTELGAPTWVPVVQTGPGWDEVLLPSRPNGASGWIFTGGASSSQLELRHTPYLISIQLGARKLTLTDGGRVVGTWTVAIGAPATPTPTGTTFVLALLAPTQPTYSPLILPLGFHSNSLQTFGGGPGTVGVHGWPDPSVFGEAVSNGCVRVPDSALRTLSRVPLGSLVSISS